MEKTSLSQQTARRLYRLIAAEKKLSPGEKLPNELELSREMGVSRATLREAIRELEKNTGKTYEKLYIVGGGAKNQFLNCLTQETTGKEVVALPIEATALGNLKIQIEAASK